MIRPDDIFGPFVAFTFTYDSSKRLVSVTDGLYRTTSYAYDSRDRRVQTQFNDGSTERVAYGDDSPGWPSNQIVARQDRNGVVTTFEYDNQGRQIKSVEASHRIPLADVTDASASDLLALLAGNEITDPTIRGEVTCTYLHGTNLPATCVASGELTEYQYDYRQRIVRSTIHPRDGKQLTTTKTYLKQPRPFQFGCLRSSYLLRLSGQRQRADSICESGGCGSNPRCGLPGRYGAFAISVNWCRIDGTQRPLHH